MGVGPWAGLDRVAPGRAASDPRRRAGRRATGPAARRRVARNPVRPGEVVPAERSQAGSGAVGRSPPSGSRRDARNPGPGARSVAAGPGRERDDPTAGDHHPRHEGPPHDRRHHGPGADLVRWRPPASAAGPRVEPGSQSRSVADGDHRSGGGRPAAGRAMGGRRRAGHRRGGRQAGARRGRVGSACPAGTLSLDASRRRSGGDPLDVSRRVAAIRHRSAGTSSWSAAVDPA
jgi:hypothetical protein